MSFYDRYRSDVYGPHEPQYTDPRYVEDEHAELRARMDELQAHLAQQDHAAALAAQQAAQAELDAQREQQNAETAQRLELYFDDIGLTDAERSLVVSNALVNAPVSDDGVVDLDGAVEAAVAELHAAGSQRRDHDAAQHPGADATIEDLTQWGTAELRRRNQSDTDLARFEEASDIANGVLDPSRAKHLTAWEAEGREPHMVADQAAGISEAQAHQEMTEWAVKEYRERIGDEAA